MIRQGDCREVMLDMLLDGEQFDAVVTDPPYDLTSTVERFGKPGAAPAKDATFARMSRGFMGRTWDGTGVAFDPATWRAVYDVLKPGAHLLAFGGSRTYHRMACAIEDAGFELRDCIMWLYGTGFPKSLDVSKAIDKAAGATRDKVPPRSIIGHQRNIGNHRPYMDDPDHMTDSDTPATAEAAQWQGWGTALKPAFEPIIVARKPLGERTVAANVLAHGTGAINIDACRVPLAEDDKLQDGVTHAERALDESGAWGFKAVDRAPGIGRHPANVLHDGSDEVEAAFAAFGQRGGGSLTSTRGGNTSKTSYGFEKGTFEPIGFGDSGTASRFFYSAKAGKADRVVRILEDVEIEWISEQGPCRLVLQVDTEQSRPKVIEGLASADANEWSTFLCGSGITDLCRRASKFTTLTKTKSTIELTTWKSLTTSLINAFTEDASWSAENGKSLAENAGAFSLSATIIVGETESLPGANHAVSKTPLKISVSAKQHAHPTCKPLALMRWLCTLVTPPGGRLLDPFAGSGTTLQAALECGFVPTGIEAEAEYIADIENRLLAYLVA